MRERCASVSGCFYREWTEPAEESHSEVPTLRVLSLNILADGLTGGGADPSTAHAMTPQLFVNDDLAGGVALLVEDPEPPKFDFVFRCEAAALEWKCRWPSLLQLILEQDPDVIGLQEVDLKPGDRQGPSPAHDAEIRKDLSEAGYDGTFACKQGRACDGVGLFWRRSRLRKTAQSTILKLGGVFVACAQPLVVDDTWHFTAVATHLKAGLNAEAEKMRTGQIQSLVQQTWQHEHVILLADLNAHCRPWVDDAKNEVIPRAYPVLTEQLWSAYKEVLGEEPGFTSWGGWGGRDVRGVFDYVFYRGDIFTAASVLKTPTGSDVLQYPERLPNPLHPTDHVPMVVDFKLNPLTPSAKRHRW